MITLWLLFFFFFKQKTAYEMRISDWSSDVCSSDLAIDNIGLEGGAVPQDARRDAILVDRHSQRMGQIGVLGLRHAVAIEDVGRRAPHEPVTRALDPAGDRKSVVLGKSVSVRLDLVGRLLLTTKQINRLRLFTLEYKLSI